jgi:streptomycin 6-kinase
MIATDNMRVFSSKMCLGPWTDTDSSPSAVQRCSKHYAYVREQAMSRQSLGRWQRPLIGIGYLTRSQQLQSARQHLRHVHHDLHHGLAVPAKSVTKYIHHRNCSQVWLLAPYEHQQHTSITAHALTPWPSQPPQHWQHPELPPLTCWFTYLL